MHILRFITRPQTLVTYQGFCRCSLYVSAETSLFLSLLVFSLRRKSHAKSLEKSYPPQSFITQLTQIEFAKNNIADT